MVYYKFAPHPSHGILDISERVPMINTLSIFKYENYLHNFASTAIFYYNLCDSDAIRVSH